MPVDTQRAPQTGTRPRTRVAAGTGGVAGNSRLTAVTAAVLLVLLAVEGFTLLSLQSFLSWHILWIGH